MTEEQIKLDALLTKALKNEAMLTALIKAFDGVLVTLPEDAGKLIQQQLHKMTKENWINLLTEYKDLFYDKSKVDKALVELYQLKP